MANLFKSFMVVGIERALYMLIQFASAIILARLVSPDDFGIVGITAVFTALSSLLVDSGMGGSLVYHKDSDKKDFSTIFWFNLSIAITAYIILFLISGTISKFYEIPILEPIIKISGLAILFTSFGFTQLNKLTKELQFKKLALINVIAYALATVAAIILAIMELGVWALVMQQLLHSCIKTILLFFYAKFWPSFYFSKKLLKKHFSFGCSLMFSSFLKTTYDNVYSFVMGKWMSITTVGYFNQAKRVQDLPYQFTSTILDQATFPIMAKIQDDNTFGKTARKILRFILVLFLPLLMIMSLCSNEIVIILLGEKWIEAAPILTGLAFGSIALLGEAINRNFIKAKGATKLIFKLELFKKSTAIILVIAMVRFDVIGLVITFIFNAFIAYLCNIWGTSSVSSFKYKQQIKDFIQILVLAVTPYIICQLAFRYVQVSYITSFAIKTLLYLAIYICILIIIRNAEIRLIFSKIKQFRNKL